MSVFNFEADVVVHNRGIDVELRANAIGQSLRVACFQENYVAADLAGQGLGRAQRYQTAFVQDGEAVAAFGFFHQVRGDDDGDALLIAEDLEVLPKVAPGAGIEAGRGLVEEQNLRMVEQAFGQLDAALHTAGKCFHAVAGAVQQSYTREYLCDSLLEFGAAQPVEMSLMPEIFIGGELGVDALGLEDDADVAAQGAGLANGVQAGDHGAAGSRNHERGKNSEQSGLAAAVRTEKTEEFGGANVERDAVERDAILVAMHEIANGNSNDGLGRGRGRLSGGGKVDRR